MLLGSLHQKLQLSSKGARVKTRTCAPPSSELRLRQRFQQPQGTEQRPSPTIEGCLLVPPRSHLEALYTRDFSSRISE